MFVVVGRAAAGALAVVRSLASRPRLERVRLAMGVLPDDADADEDDDIMGGG